MRENVGDGEFIARLFGGHLVLGAVEHYTHEHLVRSGKPLIIQLR